MHTAQAGPLNFEAAYPCRATVFPAAMSGFPSPSRLARSPAVPPGFSGSVEAAARRRGGVLWLLANDLLGSAMWRAVLGVAAVRHEGGLDGETGSAAERN